MKFSEKVGTWQWASQQTLTFWWRSGSRIRIRIRIQTCLGGGMHCLSAYSYRCDRAEVTTFLIVFENGYLRNTSPIEGIVKVKQQQNACSWMDQYKHSGLENTIRATRLSSIIILINHDRYLHQNHHNYSKCFFL